MKKRRADFEAEVKANLKAGEAALQASKTQLEKHWASFEAELKTYVETVGKDIDQKRATFADIAAAQAKAWGDAVEKLQSAAAELGAENRAKVDKAIAQVRADTTEAKAHLEELKQAGNESWAALSAALQTSRKKFDEASQSAWEALKNSVPTIKS
jgi:glutathione S-transferase